MKKTLLTLAGAVLVSVAAAQTKDPAKVQIIEGGKGYYYETILKDISKVDDQLSEKEPYKRFVMDQSKMEIPNKVDLYTKLWAFPPISQGNTGSCWCFSTVSMLESEIYRIQKKEVKLSEMYVVYWEYVLKATGFIEKRGNSLFAQGSEGNAVARVASTYGLVPEKEYTGKLNGRQFHTHKKMYGEMKAFLDGLKETNAWNKEEAIQTIKSIMNHYMGTPPTSFKVDGKEYTPMTFMKDYAKINPAEYVEILSYKQEPYWQKVEYTVPDNWWHSNDYYNIPLDDYMKIIRRVIDKGYTISIGGDVSEAGFLRETQCAIVPDFDIPTAYITEDARQFRFSNETTTDDHGMQMIGYIKDWKGDGFNWYLIKDSSSGSRNNDPNAKEFGYYFFREDYIKLKMMGFTVHKDAVKDILKKFK
ncbi:C1 family peptidase [Prolixibacteraceae bacterium]|nr:C1 family peptidase [Prolixibacteraceae bacterium]